jgi:hypothetical protein
MDNAIIKKIDQLPASAPERLQELKASTALEALRSPSGSIAKVKREQGALEYNKGLVYIVGQLFKVRYSKQEFNPQLVDEFGLWLQDKYWFLNYQEIELALMTYRGKSFHVIDLETLKTMVEEYDKRRALAVEQDRADFVPPEEEQKSYWISQLDRSTGYKRSVPGYIKEQYNRLLVQTNIKRSSIERERPGDLESLLFIQGFHKPGDLAERIKSQWREEWDIIKQTAEELDRSDVVEPLDMFLRKKESFFITLNTRPIPLK